jgi:tetratricopeptide (TPR) repeat protein
VAAVAAATYADTLRGGFLLDDQYIVVENPAIRDLSRVPDLFTQTPPGAINRNYYRPVFLGSLALDYALWELSPRGYHATSILWHVLASVLAYFVLRRLLGSPPAACAAALLFAVHPVHGEAVYLVNNRATLLSTTFFFAALLVHGGAYRSRGREVLARAAVAVLAFLAMASKEDAAVLPAALVLYDLWLRRPRGVGEAAARWLPALAAFGAYFAARAALCEPSPVSYFGGKSWEVVALTVLLVQAHAVRILFVPYDLAGTYGPDYFPEPDTVASPEVLGAAGALALLLLLSLLTWRRQRLLSFAILFHFLAVAPTTHLVPLPILFGERFLYLASLGLCLAAGVGWRALAARSPRLRGVAIGLAAAATVGFGLQTFLRAADWRDELTFWTATVRDRPRSLQARYGLAYTLMRAGRCAEALPHYDLAAALAPDSGDARLVHAERATCYLRVNEPARAAEAAELWLRRHPDDRHFQRLREAAREALQRAGPGGP